MAGKDNLIPFNQLPEEKQREIRSMGAMASAEVRREKKRMREALEIILKKPVAPEEMIPGVETTQLVKGVYAILKKMQKGDVRAAEFVRSVLEEQSPDDIPANAKKVVRERIEIVLDD